MKSQLVVLLVSLAVFGHTGETSEVHDRLANFIQSSVNAFNEFIAKVEFADSPNMPETYTIVQNVNDNKNLLFKVVARALVGLLSKPINIPAISLTIQETAIIDIQNIKLTGLENSILTMASPKTGFNLDNLTIAVPEILVEADHYHFENVDIGVIVLNGDGKLKISIKDFFFTTGLTMWYDGAFSVNSISKLDVVASSSLFELENLGNSAEEISQLLNGIAGKLLPAALQSITNDLSKLIQEANGDCTASIPMTAICVVIGNVITSIKDSI